MSLDENPGTTGLEILSKSESWQKFDERISDAGNHIAIVLHFTKEMVKNIIVIT